MGLTISGMPFLPVSLPAQTQANDDTGSRHSMNHGKSSSTLKTRNGKINGVLWMQAAS